MSKRIYVGNLPFSTNEQELRELFGSHGEVNEVDIVMDRETGRPRGFGFVDMGAGADEAIQALHGSDLGGRNLTVNEARPRTERAPRRW